jgi:hypothetical protein
MASRSGTRKPLSRIGYNHLGAVSPSVLAGVELDLTRRHTISDQLHSSRGGAGKSHRWPRFVRLAHFVPDDVRWVVISLASGGAPLTDHGKTKGGSALDLLLSFISVKSGLVRVKAVALSG